MRSFWVYNRNDAGLRCTSVRLERGNQSGFRVNVRGEYLGAEVGYQTNNIELYKGDSLRVFVEVTPKTQREPGPQLIEDKLTFLLENGVSQTVCLKAYSWNAKTFDKLDITRDTTIYDANPILIRGGIHVSQGATLQIQAGTTLYFNSQAGIEVDGTLRSLGTKDAPVVLRGSRLDRMFPYLPYDRVSGQWQGIKFNAESYENDIEYTDIHGAFNGIVADSADIDKTKLSIRQSTIHNCRGVGLSLNYVKAIVENCQITNTLLPCVYVKGGDVTINHSTIAQFYPFDGNRKQAFTIESPIARLLCRNSIITGYSDDEINDLTAEDCHFKFETCIIRTPKKVTKDSIYFINVVYEDIADTIRFGKKHFKTIDTRNLVYDFSLDSISGAIDKADPATSLPIDRHGTPRDPKPDIGAFEYKQQ